MPAVESFATSLMRNLRLAEIALLANRNERATRALEELGQELAKLDDLQLARFLELADRAELPELTARAIREASTRRAVQLGLAIALLRRAHLLGNEGLADEIEHMLADKVVLRQRGTFRHQAARMRRGPEAGMLEQRRDRRAGRTPIEAAQLGGALIATGRSRLALRYLRLCYRRWPSTPEIGRLLLNAFVMSGQPEAARAWLSEIASHSHDHVTEEWWLHLAIESGELDEALALMTGMAQAGRRKPGDLKLLRTLTAMGELDRAQEVAEHVRTDPSQSRKMVSHFGVALFGQMLNELKLYRQIRPAQAQGLPSRSETGAYFFAAKDVLDHWQAACPGDTATRQGLDVPRNIFQFWNTDPAPAAVLEIMDSWQGHPGWHHQLWNRRSATRWLSDTLGREYAKAFSMANNPAEQSDFLRLCLLYVEGGIYADADDKLVASPEALLSQGHGLLLFREPFGATANNIICAPKGHKVLARAVDMARAALIRRDNDSTWSKVGPGLLTRATALHVLDDPDAASQDLTLVRSIYMRKHVHPHVALPYKSTRHYWNAGNSAIGRIVETALRGLTEPDAAM